MIEHFYKCVSCDKEHRVAIKAILCCVVIKEIYRCKACGAEHADAIKAHEHKRRYKDNGFCPTEC